MHEFHGHYGTDPNQAPVGDPATAAAPLSPASFPGTEPIESLVPSDGGPTAASAKGPSWAERRKAKRAASGAPTDEASRRGGIPWDTRVKVAVVLSFVILVSVLVFNKVRGNKKGAKETPLASISGLQKEPGPSAPRPASAKDAQPKKTPAGSPSDSPPPIDDEPEKPDAKPLKQEGVPPDVPDPAKPDDPKKKADDLPASEPAPKSNETSKSPPQPGDDPLPPDEAGKKPALSDLPPPIDDAPVKPSKPGDSPPPIDDQPAKSAKLAPPAVAPPADPPLAATPDPKLTDPPNKEVPALPPLSQAPPTREAAPSAANSEPSRGEGFAIPSAGLSRSVASATRREADPIVQAKAAPAAATPSRSDPTEDGTIHVVRKGENFWTISRYHYASGRFYKALWDANRDVAKTPQDLYVGTSIRIPAVEDLNRDLIEAPSTAQSEARTSANVATKAAERRDLRAERASAKPDAGVALPVANPAKRPLLSKPPSTEPAFKSYVVRGRNETLRSVARDQLGDSEREDEIFRINRDEFDGDSRRLKPGMALRIPNETRKR